MTSLSVLIQIIKVYSTTIIVIVVTARLLWNKFGRGINKIPGPIFAGFSRLWRLNDVRKGQAHRTAIALHQKYGNLVRIGPNVVSVGDPAMIPVIYNMKGDFEKASYSNMGHNQGFQYRYQCLFDYTECFLSSPVYILDEKGTA